MGCKGSVEVEYSLPATPILPTPFCNEAPVPVQEPVDPKAEAKPEEPATISADPSIVLTDEETIVLEEYFPAAPISQEMRSKMNQYVDYEEVVLPKDRAYQGDWHSGKQNGIGRMVYDDLGTYQGFWKDGHAHGFGIYMAGKGSQMHGSSYCGTFLNGKAHGYGVFKFTDESFYYGLFRADKRNGLGMECHHDDLQYIGPYALGKKNGIGRLKSPNGEIYVGSFKDNEISGYGIYRWPDGRVYEGYWNMSVQEGPAKFSWPDGRTYVGEYSRGKINGKGVLSWPDGRRYDGDWKDGLQDGTGDYYKDRAQYRRATFLEGVRTRWLTDFISLESPIEEPHHSVPPEFEALDARNVGSMDRFLFHYLEKHHQISAMCESVTAGRPVIDEMDTVIQ